MTGRRTYVVACLAGHGIGPEITAAASRALAGLAREHGFAIEELHPPFDTEALTRSGHLLPAATRQATSSADAVLVAGDAAPALEGLRAALDLGARVTRVLDDTGEATTFAPLHDGRGRLDARPRVRDRAQPRGAADLGRACPRLGRRGSTGTPTPSRASRWSTCRCPRRSTASRPARPACSSAEGVLGDAVAEAPRLGGRRRLVASAYLSPTGPEPVRARRRARRATSQGTASPTRAPCSSRQRCSSPRGSAATPRARRSRRASRRRSMRRGGRRTLAGPGVTATTREFVDAVLGAAAQRPPRHGVRAGGRR